MTGTHGRPLENGRGVVAPLTVPPKAMTALRNDSPGGKEPGDGRGIVYVTTGAGRKEVYHRGADCTHLGSRWKEVGVEAVPHLRRCKYCFPEVPDDWQRGNDRTVNELVKRAGGRTPDLDGNPFKLECREGHPVQDVRKRSVPGERGVHKMMARCARCGEWLLLEKCRDVS